MCCALVEGVLNIFYHIGWQNMVSISLALKSLVSLCMTMIKVMVKVKHLG